MIKKTFTLILAVLFFSFNSWGMDQQDDVPSLLNLVVNYITQQIIQEAKDLNGKDSSEIVDAIVSKWLNPEIINCTVIDLIKSKIRSNLNSVSLCEGQVQALSEPIQALLPLGNGSIVAGGAYGDLCLWNYRANNIISSDKAHAGEITGLAILPNGNFVSAAESWPIMIWDISNNLKCLKELALCEEEDYDEGFDAITVTNNGNIISGSYNIIRIWDSNTGQCLNTLGGHKDFVKTIIVVGNKIISGSMDKTIKIWNINTGECLHTCEGHSGIILNLKLLSDGKVVSDARDNALRIWDLETGDCIDTIVKSDERNVFYPHGLVELPNNNLAVICGKDIMIWDKQTKQTTKLVGHEDVIYALVVISENIIASCSPDGTVRIWDLDSSSCIKTINIKKESLRCLEYIDGLLIVGTSSGKLYAYKPDHTFEDALLYLSRAEGG